MSRIEQIIQEIEDYIDSCKYQPLSDTKIIVNKEELEELLIELRLRVPDEIKKYQKIISQQDAILQDARSQAQNMIADATAQTNELVSEHEIMQKAYQKAGEVVEEARGQAESIVNAAIEEANGLRKGAMDYTDGLLEAVQNSISGCVQDSRERYETFLNSLKSVYDTCQQNRAELSRSLVDKEEQS